MNTEILIQKPNHLLKRNFLLLLILTAAVSFILRVINITYSSMWSDELYSMLSVHPKISLYDTLLLQRRDQPPLYFVILRLWVTLFGYTDFSARMLSIVIGSMSVFVIGWVNKKIFDRRVGLLSAFLVAFSFTQIEYSLEVRFYGLLFLLIVISFYTYYLTQKNNSSWFFHVLHGAICASVILAHHFGAFVVLIYGLFDLGAIVRTRFSIERLKYKALAYGVTLLIIVPWFYWSFTSIQTVHNYWLKTIDLGAYLLFNLKYNIVSLIILLMIVSWGVFKKRIQKNSMNTILLFQILMVTAVPLAFSYLKFPILVNRYSFALAPALYTLLALGIIGFYDSLTKYKTAAVILICIVLCADGIYYSLVDRKPLMKESWKEMAIWLKKQPGYPDIPIYSVGFMVNNRVTVDYYLGEKKVTHILYDSTGLSRHKQFFVVETNAHDRIPDAFRKHLDSNYSKEEVLFGIPAYGKGGVISIYKPIQK